jgi:protein-S-isoprenylcysteine O-methyltransferase Ste14
MRRHSPDLVGLIFGMAFVIAGVGFLVHETTDAVVNPAWVTGLGLMLLGAIALVATVARGPRDRGPGDEILEPGAVTSDE